MVNYCVCCGRVVERDKSEIGEKTPADAFCSLRCQDEYRRRISSRKVMCAIACRDYVSSSMFVSLPGPIFRTIRINSAFPLDQARNELMSYFVADRELTHLMWVDSDVILPPNLLDLFFVDAPLVAPLCWTAGFYMGYMLPMPSLYHWNPPEASRRFRSWSIDQVREALNGARAAGRLPIVETDLVGGGCYMIDRATALALRDETGEWFKLTWQEGKHVRHGEDVYIFERARERGLKFKVHLGVEVGHMKMIDVRYFAHVIYGMLPKVIYETLGKEVGDP